MGKFAIILAGIFLVSGILATGLFFASFDWNNFDQSDYFEYLNKTEKLSMQGIENMKLDFASENIIVEEIEGSEFVFNLIGYYPVSESGEYPELKLDNFDGSVKIHVEYPQRRYIFGIESRESKLYVGVPKGYKADFEVGVLSGDLKISNVHLNDLDVGSASGNIKIVSSSFSTGSFETLSGEIEITNSSYISHIGSASGEIVVKNSGFKESKIETLSGEISIENSYGMQHLGSASGDIEILEFGIKEDLIIESLSGEIDLDFKDESSIDLEFETLSGDLENDLGDIYGGNYNVFVGTSSGDLRVY